ncbi:hybrid sensor histidine kinase/response regulator [Pseudanabaena mucicola]|uniref:histidine kinase n=1 Tax=Pseudanabaena mucicola FACHB-723 TaxID=2692860 RepID=A0ABR7ZUE4_9CYAN|nr:hybrid sensor histidine kinase/response regulator [Pseudanabaena mucicola]MBD2187018.1 hybrid sensor histidine kinase/response regulator [Pseudanabaena mucicola FACHB-723]
MIKTFSILVVDDEPRNFDVIEALLGYQGYQLHHAISGKEAIAQLEELRPDLILLDMMMPEMNGIQFCQHIKAIPRWQTIPIIMVTALNEKSDLANCLNAGADDFVSKPINSIELRARVHSMLRIKQQYDDIQGLSALRAETVAVLERTLNELRGNLASRLSHEINTPLNGIVCTIELLKSDFQNMEVAEVQEILGWADESAQRLEKLTKKLLIYLDLEVSAHRQKSFQSAHTKFSSTTIATNLNSYISRLNRSNDLCLELEEAEIPLSEKDILIVLLELLDNAVKFSDIGTKIIVRSQVIGENLLLSVQNSGVGMTEKQIQLVGAFMQFNRENYEQQGTGLGLRIVKKIVELAGGQFAIASIPNQDISINLTLPIIAIA